MSLRNIIDANLVQAKALPAAAATNNTGTIDLQKVDAALEHVEVQLVVPALPALVDAKTAIFTFEDSADDITYAAIPELSTLTLTGAGGVGAAAATRTVRLPSSTRRYLRAYCTVLAAGGDNTAVSYTLQLLF